jgi:hypothetical protein
MADGAGGTRATGFPGAPEAPMLPQAGVLTNRTRLD